MSSSELGSKSLLKQSSVSSETTQRQLEKYRRHIVIPRRKLLPEIKHMDAIRLHTQTVWKGAIAAIKLGGPPWRNFNYIAALQAFRKAKDQSIFKISY